MACNDRTAFFTSDAVRSYNSWFCQKECEALTFLFEAFNSTSRYLDDLLNIDSGFFDSMVNRIYPSELQLNKVRYRGLIFGFTFIYIGCFFKTKFMINELILIL